MTLPAFKELFDRKAEAYITRLRGRDRGLDIIRGLNGGRLSRRLVQGQMRTAISYRLGALQINISLKSDIKPQILQPGPLKLTY